MLGSLETCNRKAKKTPPEARPAVTPGVIAKNTAVGNSEGLPATMVGSMIFGSKSGVGRSIKEKNSKGDKYHRGD